MTEKQPINLKYYSLYHHEKNKFFVAIKKSEPLLSKDGFVAGTVVVQDRSSKDWFELDGQLTRFRWQELDHHQIISEWNN